MQHPKKIETVHVETLEGELCIYDWQRMEVHNLNPTAATVWQLCDGQTSPQQIASQLKGDLTPAQAEELVWLSLNRLEKANLLENEVVKPAGHKVYTRRQMLVRLGVTAALLPVISSIVAPLPIEAQSGVVAATGTATPVTGTQTFDFTGAAQTFTVPAGVTTLTVDAYGAQGGDGVVGGNGPYPGGNGGYVSTTIAVTPGETLNVYVGSQGVAGVLGAGGGGAGGSNSGGGAEGGAGGSSAGGGGGGGGASDVRQGGAALANRVVVAGGGGGGGAGVLGGGGSGGVGGNTTGATGVNGSGVGSSSGGGGGTQAGGGAGGSGNLGGDGTNGALGLGGDGGGGGSTGGAGGGGGGYYGGGGGEEAGGFDDGAGGGGGSSFPAGATHTQGAQAGDGQVVISY